MKLKIVWFVYIIVYWIIRFAFFALLMSVARDDFDRLFIGLLSGLYVSMIFNQIKAERDASQVAIDTLNLIFPLYDRTKFGDRIKRDRADFNDAVKSFNNNSALYWVGIGCCAVFSLVATVSVIISITHIW